MKSGNQTRVGFPKDSRLHRPVFSPDSKRVALAVERGDQKVELWFIELESGKKSQVSGVTLNLVLGGETCFLGRVPVVSSIFMNYLMNGYYSLFRISF